MPLLDDLADECTHLNCIGLSFRGGVVRSHALQGAACSRSSHHTSRTIIGRTLDAGHAMYVNRLPPY
jgi:hypothetical protein